MGRNRKPSEELDRKGAFDKNPARGAVRAAEPRSSGPLGDPPADFLISHRPSSVALLAIWNELLEVLKDIKIGGLDKFHVEMTCRQIHKCRQAGARSGDFAQLDRYLGKLGLNPADRSRVQGTGAKTLEEEEEEWNEFADGGGARIQ